jgi:outer membrane protein OmpA-like peptidoglycan-associated protein
MQPTFKSTLNNLKMKTCAIVFACVLFMGCAGTRSLKSINNDLDLQRKEQADLMKSVEELDKKRQEKWQKGEIDEKTDSISRAYIKDLKDSIETRLNRFNIMADRQSLKKKKKEAIAYLNNVKGSYKKELENIIIFDDLFSTTTFNRLNTAAFFAPGRYQLDASSTAKAKLIMDQIIKDAQAFSSKYNSRKLKAMFIVLGYADEESIAEGTELYKDLVSNISSPSPERRQLNQELSSRRAASIKNVLKGEYESLTAGNAASNISSDFLAMGKGEQLPGGDIKDYQPVDDRRRVVLLYWSIVPEL